MPLGPSIIGASAFVAVKLIGYSLVGRQLNKWYHAKAPHPFTFGIIRTCLGVAVGVGFLYLLGGIAGHGDKLFFILLVPVRFLEWFFVIYLFYEKNKLKFSRISENSAVGIFYSFALDIPAILSAFVIPGGMWVC